MPKHCPFIKAMKTSYGPPTDLTPFVEVALEMRSSDWWKQVPEGDGSNGSVGGIPCDVACGECGK